MQKNIEIIVITKGVSSSSDVPRVRNWPKEFSFSSFKAKPHLFSNHSVKKADFLFATRS